MKWPITVSFSADFTPVIIASTQAVARISRLIFGKIIRPHELEEAYHQIKIKKIQSEEYVFDGRDAIPSMPKINTPEDSIISDYLTQKSPNTASNINMAFQYLSLHHDQSTHSDNEDLDIGEDWFDVWRHNAEKIDENPRQKMWGQILAEEAIRPGKFSTDNLIRLKKMSLEEVIIYNKVSNKVSLLSLIQILVMENKFSAKDLAKYVNKPYSTLIRESNPHDSGAKMGVETLFKLMKVTGNIEPLKWMAHELGYAIVPLK